MARPREVCWAICLAGLPWSGFVLRHFVPFQHLDLWHMNALWMQTWVLGLLGVHGMNSPTLGRLPSAAWWLLVWSTVLTLWTFSTLSKGGEAYPSGLWLAPMNLWLVALALLLMTTWTAQTLQLVLTACFWSGVALIVYGWLQVINLDQFFRAVTIANTPNLAIPVTDDQLVGTIGNPTHFACQLALWMPLAFQQRGLRKLWVLPAFGLLLIAQSSTALVTASLLTLAWLWKAVRERRHLIVGLGSLGVAMGFAWPHLPSLTSWINPFGRLEVWTHWWRALQLRPITGWGLGFVKMQVHALDGTSPAAYWHHLHNEPYQWAVETGVIGFGLLVWFAWQLWQRRIYPGPADVTLRWTCGALLIGSLLISLLNWNAHLWQLGVFGLIGLAGWISMTEQEPECPS